MPNTVSHDARRPHPVRRLHPAVPLGVAAGCAVAMMIPVADAADQSEIATLRTQGPAGLAVLLARYDRLDPGPLKNQLAYQVDQVAAQRYATVSRLYWYTDRAAAEAAAKASQRPILALRMLGRLDEEYSCANSRLFRSVLYANTEVSKLMRDNFILYWSSERPVPKVTIDMGDGRTIQRTTTGNSAHYVLDAHGNVLDVLPGMYAPAIFKQELTKSLELAAKVRTRDENHRRADVYLFHKRALDERTAAWKTIAGGKYSRGHRSFVSKLEAAQRSTMSKMVMEAPDLSSFGMSAGKLDRTEIDAWAQIGVRMWGLDANERPMRVMREPDAKPEMQAYKTFDQRSITLISWLHDFGQPRSSDAQLAQMIARLEYTVIADSALDELQLRQQIRIKLMTQPHLTFDQLNEWIYAEVFHTPKSDQWLGLVPRTDFTGLPGDGVVTR
jgi:hypothetical protein